MMFQRVERLFLSTLSLRRATPRQTRHCKKLRFLSTLSLRRATTSCDVYMAMAFCNFYPRSPCGERRCQTLSDFRYTAISIHALLAESDTVGNRLTPNCPAFLSTLSLRRATFLCFVARKVPGFLSTLSLRRATTPARILSRLLEISIHALLAESDEQKCRNRKAYINFYPRSPCGERLSRVTVSYAPTDISIHALLAESD